MNLMPAAAFRHYCFEGYRLDTRTRELRGADGQVVPLTARAFDVLECLVGQSHRVVSKDELLATVWAGRVVEENNLTQAVAALRRAFGTGGNDHRYIVTVPGRGYRFVADVREDDRAAPMRVDGRVAPVPAAAPPAGSRRGAILGAALFASALFAIAAWRLWSPGPPPAAPVPAATLAVLPFRSLSPGPRDELLELGLADTLVTRLGRSAGLRVRSLGSSRRLAAASADPLAAARELGADYVIEGSAQRVGDQVRVNARLLSVERGATLWSDTFDAQAGQVFALQDRIGDAVTSALRVQPVPPHSAGACDGADPAAYRALLRAQYGLHRRSPETIAAFQEAIRLDPACSRAYAGLATAYLALAHNDRAPRDVFPLAAAAATQALRIDPDSADAHMARGRYLQLHAWDWPGSEAAHRRAIAINPSLPEAHFALAHLLVATGRFDEGLAHARQARELDPLSPLLNALEGGFLGAAGQPEAARARVERALEFEPEFWIALLVRGGLALDRGDTAAAIADLQRAAAHSRRNSHVLAMLAVAHAAAGERGAAASILGELQARATAGYVPATTFAAVHNALGQRDEALDALRRGRDARDIRMAFLGIDARWNSLRDDPRFHALAAELRLSAARARGRF